MLLIGVSHVVQVIKSAKGVQGSALAALQSVFEHQRSSSMFQSQLVCVMCILVGFSESCLHNLPCAGYAQYKVIWWMFILESYFRCVVIPIVIIVWSMTIIFL